MSSLIYNYNLIKKKKLTVSDKHKKQLIYLVQLKHKYELKEVKKNLDNCFKQPTKKKRQYITNLPKILETIEVYSQ